MGVPGKNIKPLLGKPLICYSIEQALATPGIDRVYVSTDDAAIARVAEDAGAIVPFIRPRELATSNAPKLPVIQHLVEWVAQHDIEPQVIVDLDPTSPLRGVDDIVNCMQMLKEDVSVVITGYEAEKNPYFNMVEMKEDGSFGLVKGLAGTGVSSRQTAPKVYAMNASIYVWHRRSLSSTLWNGRVALYKMPRERSIDIDHPIDFSLVELLMAEKCKNN